MSFRSDLAFGEQGELFILKKLHYKYPKAYKVEGYYKEWDLFIPEKGIGIEVKNDRKTHESGNVVIEYQYGGKPSGIQTTKAAWWAYLTKDNLYWITPDKIKECIKDYNLKAVRYPPIADEYSYKDLYLIQEKTFKKYAKRSERLNGRD